MGQPAVCITKPGWWRLGSISHSSLMPMPKLCGSRPSSRWYLAISLLAQVAACAFGKHGVLAQQFHAELEVVGGLAVLA